MEVYILFEVFVTYEIESHEPSQIPRNAVRGVFTSLEEAITSRDALREEAFPMPPDDNGHYPEFEVKGFTDGEVLEASEVDYDAIGGFQ
jgi:hypothetical protein